jgi:hypothetical protein
MAESGGTAACGGATKILAPLLPGVPPGKSQSNSTVALWRYNFGVVASVIGRNRCGADEAHGRAS